MSAHPSTSADPRERLAWKFAARILFGDTTLDERLKLNALRDKLGIREVSLAEALTGLDRPDGAK